METCNHQVAASLLAMKTADLEKVILFQDYTVTDPGQTPLKYQQVLTEDEYRSAVEQYGDDFKAEMGAEAIRTLLEALELEQLAAQLREDLAALHFDTIKIRTFRGALKRVLDADSGAVAYIETIRAASGEFQAAAQALSAAEMVRVRWPTLPASVLVDEIRAWWDTDRTAWSRRVHGFYRSLGQGVTWPIRAAYGAIVSGKIDPVESLHRQERDVIILAVEKLLDELDRLAQVGSDTLKPHLGRLLSGHAREELLRRVQSAHDDLPPVDDDYRAFLHGELDAWKQANPRAVGFLRSLDHAAAVARPAITISLAVSGWIVAGDLAAQAAAHAAGQTAGGLATEAAIAGGITGGGEALVSTTSEGVRQAAGRLFTRLQSRYAQSRAAWLAGWLEKELLGGLLTELRHGAEVPDCQAFREVEEGIGRICHELQQ